MNTRGGSRRKSAHSRPLPAAAMQKFQQALALQQQGKLRQAEALYRQILEVSPRHFDTLHALGIVAAQSGQARMALELFDAAIAVNPQLAAPYSNRGNALLDLKRYEEALASYEQALAIQPDYAEALNNRGNVFQGLQRFEEALASYDAALALNAQYPEALNNRGNALRSVQKFEAALASYTQAVTLRPAYFSALKGMGSVLQTLGRASDALSAFERALALRPTDAETLVSAGHALVELRRYEPAIEYYARALAVQPDYPCLYGDWLHTRMKICDWADLGTAFSNVAAAIDSGQLAISPFAGLGTPLSPAQQLHCAQLLVELKFPAATSGPITTVSTGRNRIRLGYFSADLHSHATAQLMAGVFEQHDRDRFEVIAFSFGPGRSDPMRRRLEAAFDEFHDVRLQSDDEIVALARSMNIDIAIDLKGFTQDGRTGIFARRAAPLQVNHLGFPGTMGANYFDYLIADPLLIAADETADYSEKIVWLPHSYQPNDEQRVIADRAISRRDAGLPDGSFVYCCFNNNWKITPEVFGLWMDILSASAGSVLWLFEDNASVAAYLRREAEQRGVAADRLIFALRVDGPEHLARHRLADLFLDTAPYNAHTTASDALWAGLPVLTRRGQTFASRVAASLLTAIGLPELITDSPDAYRALAIELASDAPRLAALREKLAVNRLSCPLFNTRLFARHIEAAYTTMCQRHQAGLPPDHIVVPA